MKKQTARTKTNLSLPKENLVNTLAIDLGGTKVAAGVVRSDGKILEQLREPAKISEGPKVLIDQLATLVKKLSTFVPNAGDQIGLASAGPLDIDTGTLLDPTNFKGPGGKRFGIFKIAQKLEEATGKSVILENDAAAAVLAEAWLGDQNPNQMVLTLGTGLGVGVICNGKLVRAGRMQHPEGGHLILNASDFSALCGCGNYGCAEAYLSGKNFTLAARVRLGEDLSTEEIVKLARRGKKEYLALFEDYSEWMAIYLHNCAVIYAPEIISLSGGFAEAHDLFLPRTQERLEQFLERRRKGIDLLPIIRPSKLGNNSGLLGAASLVFRNI